MTLVISGVRTLIAGRIAAALVAVALSGAAQLHLPEAQHGGAASGCRCGSHHTEHLCSCPVCHSARIRDLDQLPPCHRAAAREKLARVERQGDLPGPCMKGSCGQPESPQATTTRFVERFTVPDSAAPVLPERSEELPLARALAQGLTTPPETPPPRIG
jgi:hypothetical protein